MAFNYSMTPSNVKIYKGELNHFLNDPSGEVGDYLKGRGRVILLAAEGQVGVDTGQLKSSLYMIHSRNGLGQFVKIGSNNDIALIHHEGTRPHMITPRDQTHLRFSKGGRMVYSRAVMHPGTQPNRYLSDNLYLAYV